MSFAIRCLSASSPIPIVCTHLFAVLFSSSLVRLSKMHWHSRLSTWRPIPTRLCILLLVFVRLSLRRNPLQPRRIRLTVVRHQKLQLLRLLRWQLVILLLEVVPTRRIQLRCRLTWPLTSSFVFCGGDCQKGGVFITERKAFESIGMGQYVCSFQQGQVEV
jgi:hypothetical protein